MPRPGQAFLGEENFVVAVPPIPAVQSLVVDQRVEQVDRGVPQRGERVEGAEQMVGRAVSAERHEPAGQGGVPARRDVERAEGVAERSEGLADAARPVDRPVPRRDRAGVAEGRALPDRAPLQQRHRRAAPGQEVRAGNADDAAADYDDVHRTAGVSHEPTITDASSRAHY